MSATEIRIILILLGIVVLGLIYWFGRPERHSGVRRRPGRGQHRVEPILDVEDAPEANGAEAADEATPSQPQLELGIEDDTEDLAATGGGVMHGTGTRLYGDDDVSGRSIFSVYVVAASEGRTFRGPDIVVAAEKTGLEYGDLGIFHRLPGEGNDTAAVFSAASMVEPGSFDMDHIRDLETPGLTLFMVLPGPLPALDAWEAMLPTARRLAELLDGRVVDDEHNALGRQRIAHIRDKLRAWDREHQD